MAFEIEKLQADPPREIVLVVTCLGKPKGQEPTITLLITDEIRLAERKISAKHNRFVFTEDMQNTREGTVRSDKLSYCEEMIALVVKDSQGLFENHGVPVTHKNDYLIVLLRRYPKFLDWFAEALTGALKDDQEFRAAFADTAVKN